MAGDWIKVQCCTPDKPEILTIAKELKISRDAAVGVCIRVWIWADQHARSGSVTVTPVTLDEALHVTDLCVTLEKVGWLRITETALHFTNLEKHMAHTAKERALTAARVKKHRNARNALQPLPEKRREEKIINTPLPPLPSALNTPEFVEAWEQWVAQRKEIKKPMTARSMSMQLKKLTVMGAQRAVACLEYSIGNGYQGLFEEQKNGKHVEPVVSTSERLAKKQEQQAADRAALEARRAENGAQWTETQRKVKEFGKAIGAMPNV